LKKQITPPS